MICVGAVSFVWLVHWSGERRRQGHAWNSSALFLNSFLMTWKSRLSKSGEKTKLGLGSDLDQNIRSEPIPIFFSEVHCAQGDSGLAKRLADHPRSGPPTAARSHAVGCPIASRRGEGGRAVRRGGEAAVRQGGGAAGRGGRCG